MTPRRAQQYVVSESGPTPDRRRRPPGPLRWIWYAVGGSLGPRYRQWVLHDLTCRSRWTRQTVRAAVQVVPLAVVLLLTLGTGWVTWIGVICGLVLALIYSMVYFDQSADYRLVKHGFPAGTAREILSERDKAEHPDRMRRYIETYRSDAG
jgi:fatty acid desaturase